LQQVAQFDEVGGDDEAAVIILDLFFEQRDAVGGPLQPLGGAHNADIVPHKAADLGPVLLDHNHLIGIGHAAFIPGQDRGRLFQLVPLVKDVRGRRFAIDKAFEQAVRCQSVRAVKAAFGAFTRRPKTGQIGARKQIHHHAAARIMLRRHNRDRPARHIDAKPCQLLVNRREVLADEIRAFMADIEMDVIKTIFLDLRINRARHDITRGELHALSVIILHETLARLRVVKPPAFAAHSLGDEEVFDFEIVEAGRVELHHLHVGDARARSPSHRNAVSGRAARGGGELIDTACPACGEDGCARNVALDFARFFIERIDAPNPACGGELLAIAISDEVNRGAPAQHGDVGIGLGCFEQSALHCPTGCIIDMDNAAVRVPPFARQV